MQTLAGSLVYNNQKPTRKRIDSRLKPVALDRQRAVVSFNAQGCSLDLSERWIALGLADNQLGLTSQGLWM